MSRVPHIPTPALRQLVKSRSAVGLPQEDIAAIIGISEKTLRLYYRQELDEGMEEANAAVVGFLMAAIERGTLAAMIFADKCGMGKKSITRPKTIVPEAPKDLPCTGVGMCAFRTAEYYVPGEEAWPHPHAR